MSSGNVFYRVMWEKVPSQYIEGLNSGKYAMYNGVLRNTSASREIVKHLPLEAITLNDSALNAGNLLEVTKGVQAAQAAITGAIAISTAAVMGAIVVSTTYLSKKIDKLHLSINNIQKEIHDQNLVYYADKIAGYFGAVESLREIIATTELVEENRDLILMKISSLGTQRNQMVSFLNSLLWLSDGFTPSGKAAALDYLNMSMMLFPKGICIESQAAYKIERFHCGDVIRTGGQEKYRQLAENYRSWRNDKVRSIHAGSVTSGEQVLMSKLEDIKSVLSSEENKLLLNHSF